MTLVDTLESQATQILIALVLTAVLVAIGFLTRKGHQLINAHLKGKAAQTANLILNSLNSIAVNVVQDINQRTVNDAKKNGAWTPDLMKQVKQDAVDAVMSQGSSLVALGQSLIGDMNTVVSSAVEGAVAAAKRLAPTVSLTAPVAVDTLDLAKAAPTVGVPALDSPIAGASA